MAISNTKASLDFTAGIDAVSHLAKASEQPELPQTKRIIYFSDDAAPSHLAKLFRGFNSKQLIEKACRPSRQEYESSPADFSGVRAIEASQWLATLDTPIDTQLKEKAEALLQQIAEIELKTHIQRNLLKQV